MINYNLPIEIEIDGIMYPINRKADYRVILDVISAMNDQELKPNKRVSVALNLFYDFNCPPNIESAYVEMSKFINGGDVDYSNAQKAPLMNWEHDFPVIVPAINKSLNCEIRAVDYMHWWTFLSGYMEIDEKSVFSTIVSLRRKLRDGVKLEKYERAFINANRNLVNMPNVLSDEDKQYLMEVE